LAKSPAKKSSVRFFHAEPTFEKKWLRDGIAKAGFGSEKGIKKPKNCTLFKKCAAFGLRFFVTDDAKMPLFGLYAF
jgi:hypothetical protein